MSLHDQMICGDFWDANGAAVVCNQLGHGLPKEVFTTSRFGSVASNYQNFTPVCTGKERKLEDCRMVELPSACSSPAGLTCSRVAISEDGMPTLDGQPVCASGLSDIEAGALCRDLGYSSGTFGDAHR